VIESSNIWPLLPLCSSGDSGIFMSQTIMRYAKQNYANTLGSVVIMPLLDIHVNCDITLMQYRDKPMTVHALDFIEVTQRIFGEFFDNPAE